MTKAYGTIAWQYSGVRRVQSITLPSSWLTRERRSPGLKSPPAQFFAKILDAVALRSYWATFMSKQRQRIWCTDTQANRAVHTTQRGTLKDTMGATTSILWIYQKALWGRSVSFFLGRGNWRVGFLVGTTAMHESARHTCLIITVNVKFTGGTRRVVDYFASRR